MPIASRRAGRNVREAPTSPAVIAVNALLWLAIVAWSVARWCAAWRVRSAKSSRCRIAISTCDGNLKPKIGSWIRGLQWCSFAAATVGEILVNTACAQYIIIERDERTYERSRFNAATLFFVVPSNLIPPKLIRLELLDFGECQRDLADTGHSREPQDIIASPLNRHADRCQQIFRCRRSNSRRTPGLQPKGYSVAMDNVLGTDHLR